MCVPSLPSLLAIISFSLLFFSSSAACPSSSSHCLTVSNQCGATLFLQRTIIDGPENNPSAITELASGATTVLDISAWQGVPAQRLYAWWVDPMQTQSADPISMRDKAELFLCGRADAPEMCYNPTAVDYFALPVRLSPFHADDCPGKPATGSSMRLSSVRAGCPTHFVSTPPLGICQSPARMCADAARAHEPMCSAFDSVIAQCVADGNCDGAAGISTADAYACAGWMSQQPQWCAAINRGVYARTPSEQNDSALFYQRAPFNEYAAWVHARSQRQYAFPFDDYRGGGSSGYQQCETNHLRVEWCPEDTHSGAMPASTAQAAVVILMTLMLNVCWV